MKPSETRKCAECGERYRPSYAPQRFCSRDCWYASNRSGATKTCVVCEEEFYVRRSALSQKYCSHTCRGLNCRKEKACSVCGETFSPGPRRTRRKTCSRECWNKASSAAKKGSKNPNYTNGYVANRERWESQAEPACRLCGSDHRLQLHHVTYEQHVRDEGGDVFDPANSFTICWGCHNKHHRSIDKRIPLDKLREENLAFIRALLGDAGSYYLIRHYGVDDPAALIAEWTPVGVLDAA